MPMISLEAIQDKIIKEDTILQLAFPNLGLVHLRAITLEEIPYVYDELDTIQPGDTSDSTPQRLGVSSYNIDNAIEVTEDLHLYQMFYGISPGMMRVRVGYPAETMKGGLDVRGNQINGKFGYVDGFRSPLEEPQPISELIIPPDFDVGFVFHNPDTIPVKPVIYWHIISMNISVIRDAELIYNIMAGNMPAGKVMKKSMGGATPFKFHPTEMWALKFINPEVQDYIDIASTTGNNQFKRIAMESIANSLGLDLDLYKGPISIPPPPGA